MARYHYLAGNSSATHTSIEIFGRRTISSVGLPCYLDLLEKRINNPYLTSEYFINNHTFFPYYNTFFMPSQSKKVKQMMKSEFGQSAYATAGISASRIESKHFLMHCEKCIEEDIDAYGETYWHRIHQLPGIYICHKHNKELHETIVPLRTRNQYEYITATYENVKSNGSHLPIDKQTKPYLLKLAKLTNQLLRGVYYQKEPDSLYKQYKNRLISKGLCSVKGSVSRMDLINSFRSVYNEQFLKLLQSPINETRDNWLSRIFRYHRRSFHPIRHLLVMMFFGENLESYFQLNKEYLPFGNGPWYCLNPMCQDFHTTSVTNLRITPCYNTKKPVGTFACHCGFVYSRRGPDISESDSFKIGRVKEFGDVWKKGLLKLVHEGGSMRGIARQLRCDPITVKRHASLMGVSFSWNNEKLKQAKEEFDSIKKKNSSDFTAHQDKLNQWIDLQSNNPNLSITKLRKIRPELYGYIYRHDRDWLFSNSPKGNKKIVVNNKVNWEERDKHLLESVRLIVQDWDSKADILTRITISEIGRRINKISLLQKKGYKLPKTMEYIQNVVEDVESFQIRRVKWAKKQLRKSGEEIKEWKLYRKASLRRNISNKVKREIIKCLEEYDYEVNNDN